MRSKQIKKMQALSAMIGNTPLLAINFYYQGDYRTIYAKAEYFNLTGSIKDRMAYHVIRRGYEDLSLMPGARILEATSGNTGIAFAGLGKALGHPVTIFMPDWMSEERKQLIQSFGADIHLVSREEGGFLGSIEMADQIAKQEDNTFLPHQFANDNNCQAHYLSTGPELFWQLKSHGLTPDAFVAGVGTGGTVMGIGRYLKEMVPGISVHPLEPANSPTLSTGHKVGKHRIQGISDDFIPDIVRLDEMDEVVGVDDGDAILMARKLSQVLGLGVGISSGANFIGALKLQEKLGPNAVVATVFSDDNKKYLSTDLVKDEPVKDDFLSPGVTLTDYRAYRPVCDECFDPMHPEMEEKLRHVGLSFSTTEVGRFKKVPTVVQTKQPLRF